MTVTCLLEMETPQAASVTAISAKYLGQTKVHGHQVVPTRLGTQAAYQRVFQARKSLLQRCQHSKPPQMEKELICLHLQTSHYQVCRGYRSCAIKGHPALHLQTSHLQVCKGYHSDITCYRNTNQTLIVA